MEGSAEPWLVCDEDGVSRDGTTEPHFHAAACRGDRGGVDLVDLTLRPRSNIFGPLAAERPRQPEILRPWRSLPADRMGSRRGLARDVSARGPRNPSTSRARMSATLGLGGCYSRPASETKDACTGAFARRNPVRDRSGVEGARSFLRFGAFAGLLAQQPSAHQQHQESFSNRAPPNRWMTVTVPVRPSG